MAKKNTATVETLNTNTVETTVETVTQEQLALLVRQAELLEQLAEKEAALKALTAIKGAEEEDLRLAEQNPQYVKGSLRRPTTEDRELLGKHCHGIVVSVKCCRCGVIRTINKQDNFQVRACKTCVPVLQKEKNKAKRAANPAKLTEAEAEIARLRAQLEALKG